MWKRVFYLVCAVVVILCASSTALFSQAIDPAKSARAAATSDGAFITENIRDNEDAVFLSRQALERSKDERVKELAQLMLDNHLAMLYAMEQLDVAGKGVSTPGNPLADNRPEAAAINEKLARLSGPAFDSVWTASMLPLQQTKYDEFTQARETVTNTQLKMAVAEALPLLRKHLSQLRSVEKYLVRNAIQRRKEAAAAAKQQQLNR